MCPSMSLLAYNRSLLQHVLTLCERLQLESSGRWIQLLVFATSAPPSTGSSTCAPGSIQVERASSGAFGAHAASQQQVTCSWILAPVVLSSANTATVPTSVTVMFTEFNLVPGKDAISVYACADVTCLRRSLVLALSGNLAPAPLTSHTGIIMVSLVSESRHASRGFSAAYHPASPPSRQTPAASTIRASSVPTSH